MRTLIVLIHCISIFHLQAQSEKIELPVTAATIYEQGVTVERTGILNIVEGASTFEIINLPFDMNESTMNVFIDGGVIIQAQKIIREYIKPKQPTKAYESEKQLILDSIDLIQAYISILDQEQNILNNHLDLSSEKENFTPAQVSLLKSNYATEMKSVKEDHLKFKIKLRNLNNVYKEILQKINSENVVTGKNSVTLKLELKSDVDRTSKIEISYFQSDAGWIPTYDLRVDGLNAPITVVYKANLYQNTGENWKDVQLSLSTAQPVNDYSLPYLSPYYLSFNNYYSNRNIDQFKPVSGRIQGRVTDVNGEVMIGANIIIKGTMIGTITDIDGAFSLNVPSGSNYLGISFAGYETITVPIDRSNIVVSLAEALMLDDVVVTGYAGAGAVSSKRAERIQQAIPLSIIKSQTSINYDITAPLSINSGTEHQSVFIRNEQVAVNYSYKAFPKVEKNAYLIAEIEDWAKLQILFGKANIYIDNRYIGQTDIGEGQDERDSYILSLGQDRDVYVERSLERGYSTRKVIGNNRIAQRKWSLKVNNNKGEDVRIYIEDQYPVSKTSDIKVNLKEHSEAYFNKDLGELKWELIITPYSSKEIIVEYEVKSPKSRNLLVE